MSELNIIEKRTNKGARYFTDPPKIDGFDGTAQGYGYKTKQAIYKAFSYHQNRGKMAQNEIDARHFLEENPEIKALLDDYMDDDACFYRMKDREPTSIPHFISEIKADHPELVEKLREAKSLHRALLKLYD